MKPSNFSLLAILAAALAIGSPVPGISETVKPLGQPGPLSVNNITVGEATGKSSLPILSTGEPVQFPGPNNGQYGNMSVATAETVNLKRRDQWSYGCTREIEYKWGQCINMINATPYRWRKGYSHSYRVSAWEDRWPEYIEPGESIAVLARTTSVSIFRNADDSAGEVAYHLEGTDKPMSFMLEYRSGTLHLPWIRLLEDLEVMNHHKGAEFNLGARVSPYGVGFILAGTEGDFVTNDGPAAWMQAMVDDIGHKPLREIVLGRSHHAGMYKVQGGFPGMEWNTVTQMATLYDQLRNGGARVLDARVVRAAGGRFRAGHGTLALDSWWGTWGVAFDELIEQTNQFNEDYPGELIIWDLHPTEAFESDGYLSGERRAEFLESLKALNHRVRLPEGVDITKMPLNKFINSRDKQPAVIIRVDERWLEDVDPADWPGPSEGFVTNRQFPMTSTWSEKMNIEDVVEHQLQSLDEVEVSRTSEVYDMQWLQTLVGFFSVWPFGASLISIADQAWDAAFRDLFNALTPERYPNWLTFDNIRNSEMKTLVMAMNQCFVLDKCGDWVHERR
ncbi:unnamed protein product [Clonostachys byssicola]|uniref:LysM domain-containing protein n=1 Tax=Clonostachys byssicola TaxID=160290 RepID=A0A9N9YB01_9HYPO|nr:unnamed protein product [Clonostachys byssicola]